MRARQATPRHALIVGCLLWSVPSVADDKLVPGKTAATRAEPAKPVSSPIVPATPAEATREKFATDARIKTLLEATDEKEEAGVEAPDRTSSNAQGFARRLGQSGRNRTARRPRNQNGRPRARRPNSRPSSRRPRLCSNSSASRPTRSCRRFFGSSTRTRRRWPTPGDPMPGSPR